MRAISTHEEICALRYDNIHKTLSRLENIIKWAGSTLFVTLVATISWMASELYESTKVHHASAEIGSVVERS